MPLLQNAIDANMSVCEQNDIELKLVLQQLEGEVRVDRDRFQQVMTNLISNAAKFSPAERRCMWERYARATRCASR
jgi:signal transduction histidine kinase